MHNSRIELSKTGTHVPRECRGEFYSLVDAVLDALAADVIADDGNFAEQATAHLNEARTLIREATGTRVTLPSELASFCKDARHAASEPFLSEVLSCLQGNLSPAELHERAARQIPAVWRQLTLASYEAWLAYTTVLALKPQRAYLADTPDQKRVATLATDEIVLGRQKYSPTLRIPEAVFACEDGFWAMKFELAQELDFYASKPLRRRDFSAGGDTRGTIGRRNLLLYRVPNLDSVPFAANRDKKLVFPPTAVVGAFWPGDFDQNLYGRAAVQRVLTLKPRKGGTFVALDGCRKSAEQTAASYGPDTPVRVVEPASPFDISWIAPFVANLA